MKTTIFCMAILWCASIAAGAGFEKQWAARVLMGIAGSSPQDASDKGNARAARVVPTARLQETEMAKLERLVQIVRTYGSYQDWLDALPIVLYITPIEFLIPPPVLFLGKKPFNVWLLALEGRVKKKFREWLGETGRNQLTTTRRLFLSRGYARERRKRRRRTAAVQTHKVTGKAGKASEKGFAPVPMPLPKRGKRARAVRHQ